MPKIWSYGTINFDIITQTIDQWPEKSGLVQAENIDFKMGGVSLNPAAAVGKLGGIPVGLIGYVGDDPAGQLVKRELEALNIDTSRLVVVKSTSTGICIVCVHRDGERSFIWTAGANAKLRTHPLPVDALQPGDYLHIGAALGLVQLPGLLQQAQSRQASVSVDMTLSSLSDEGNQAMPRLLPSLPFVDIFTANASEAERLTGTSDPVQSAQIIAAEGPKLVIIKMGGAGSYLLTEKWEEQLPPFKVDVVDTTGAGDALAGSLLYGLAKGWDIRQAATFANAVAALCVTTPGASDGIRTYAETAKFIQDQGRAESWDWS